MWSNFLELVTMRAAKFWTACNLQMLVGEVLVWVIVNNHLSLRLSVRAQQMNNGRIVYVLKEENKNLTEINLIAFKVSDIWQCWKIKTAQNIRFNEWIQSNASAHVLYILVHYFPVPWKTRTIKLWRTWVTSHVKQTKHFKVWGKAKYFKIPQIFFQVSFPWCCRRCCLSSVLLILVNLHATLWS